MYPISFFKIPVILIVKLFIDHSEWDPKFKSHFSVCIVSLDPRHVLMKYRCCHFLSANTCPCSWVGYGKQPQSSPGSGGSQVKESQLRYSRCLQPCTGQLMKHLVYGTVVETEELVPAWGGGTGLHGGALTEREPLVFRYLPLVELI